MSEQKGIQLFRLAAVLYADNNYEVSTNTILRKVMECALLTNDNKPFTTHGLIDFILANYNLNVSEDEIFEIIEKANDEYFLINKKQDNTFVCLSEKRRLALDTKLNEKTIDFFINEFIDTNDDIREVQNAKDIIYRFLYELLSTNVESFKKLLNSKKEIDDLINVESNTYLPNEREVINGFLRWDNDEKNKSIFDIASYALEYCMISNNGKGTHIQLNNLKNKVFYLDTNVIYRALGINGVNRQRRTNTFLDKVIETGSTLVVSKFSELELKDSITYYVDKLKENPINNKIYSKVFELKYFRNLSSFYDFFYKWRIGKANDNLDLFEAHILSLYDAFKTKYKITSDYKIPFDEKDEKTIEKIGELADGISSQKSTDNSRQNATGNNYDASNVFLIETKREGKERSIFETKLFFISTDQSLRRWDYYRNLVTPIVLLPSQWLSIILRFINRTNDDYKSFISFLNLPSGETQIDNSKIHLILKGISEMTSNAEQQRFLAQTLVQRNFEGVLDKKTNDNELIEKTKQFAETELQKQIEKLEKSQENLKSEFDTHKTETKNQIGQLEQKATKEAKERRRKEEENKNLKNKLRETHINQELKKWKKPAKWSLLLITLIITFFYFQLFHSESEFNYVEKLINYIDNNPSETKRNWMMGVNFALLASIIGLITFCWNRLFSKDKRDKKIEVINKNMPEEFKIKP